MSGCSSGCPCAPCRALAPPAPPAPTLGFLGLPVGLAALAGQHADPSLDADPSVLRPGDYFGVGDAEAMRSPDNANGFSLDPDGFLRVHRGSDVIGPWGPGTPKAARAELLPNGSLVVEDADGRALWQTAATTALPDPFLKVQDDGNVVIYERTATGVHPIWRTDTQSPSTLDAVFHAVTALANVFLVPGLITQTAILTGHDPVAAFKADVSNFKTAASIATILQSGGALDDLKSQVDALFKAQIPSLTPADFARIEAEVQSAVQSGDPSGVLNLAASYSGMDPTKIQALVSSPDYQPVWTVVTNAGRVHVDSLPAPSGLGYMVDARAYAGDGVVTPPAWPAYVVGAAFKTGLSVNDLKAQGIPTDVWRSIPGDIQTDLGANGYTSTDMLAALVVMSVMQSTGQTAAQVKAAGIPTKSWDAVGPRIQAALAAAGYVEAKGLSTGAKVAIGTAGAAGTVAVGLGVASFLTHQAIGTLVGKAWSAVVDTFRR